MPNLYQLSNNKDKIVDTIKRIGPSFPARIARETGLSQLFAAAFLAELVEDKRLKISDMKVGSSPLYFLEGQEKDLENFIQHLNPKEREAFEILKKSEIIEDTEQDPAIRVALRKIKDFATAINTTIDNQQRIFWKYHLIPDSELRDRIALLISPQQKEQVKEKTLENQTENVETKQIKSENPAKKEVKEQIVKKEKKKQEKDFDFEKQIRNYLEDKKIELVETLESKKKEYSAKVRADTIFGKQDFYLIAKDKKKLSSTDLAIAVQTAQTQKMPALILAPGELDKTAKLYIDEWRNLLKYEQIKL